MRRLLDCQRQVTLHRLHLRLWPVAEAGGRVQAIIKAAACCGSRGGTALGRAISVRNEAVAPAVRASYRRFAYGGCLTASAKSRSIGCM